MKFIYVQLLIFLSSFALQAQTATEPTGSGTSGTPYIISEAGHLVWISQNNSLEGGMGFEGTYFTQTADIDMSSVAGLAPIGNSSMHFSGNYNGGGFNISNLNSNSGLFGYIGSDGTIFNVNLVDINVTGSSGFNNVGGLCEQNLGTIDNCFVSGSVTASYRAAALASVNVGVITNCSSNANISATTAIAGGIVGDNLSVVENCNFSGSVNGPMRVGGLAGSNHHNNGLIKNSYSTGSVEGDISVGGIIGLNGIGKVENSFYDLNQVLINSQNYITVGALPDSMYQDWVDNGYSLNVSDYSDNLTLSSNTIEINNAHGLINALGFINDNNYNFKLTDNIDMSDSPGFYLPAIFSEFDGNGFAVSNVEVNQEFADAVGFFGIVGENGVVKNIGVENVNIAAGEYGGGLVGISFGDIQNCYSTGSVEAVENAGGLVGSLFANTTVSNSYSNANVSSQETAGGLIGLSNMTPAPTVTNSYSTGEVQTGTTAGGLIGIFSGEISNITGSFWNSETSNISTSAGGEAKTTLEMTQQTLYESAGWNFSQQWQIDDGVTYPYLAWQTEAGDHNNPSAIMITTLPSPIEAGSVTGQGTYIIGETVELSATPNEGWEFVEWVDNSDQVVSTNATFDFVIPESDKELTAKFVEGEYQLSIELNPRSAGSYTVSPEQEVYKFGESITIQLTENQGYDFTGWYNSQDDLVSSDLTYTFNMPADNLELTGKFDIDYSQINTFNFVVGTTEPNQEYKFVVDDAVDLTVFWPGDSIASFSGNVQPTFEFEDAGEYVVRVAGEASRIAFFTQESCPFAPMLKDIETPISNGITGLSSGMNMFRETTVESFSTVDFLDDASSGITDMRNMFQSSDFNGNLSNWDVSNVTNMSYMFAYNRDFNSDISGWDVSGVTNMSEMFSGAYSFNQDIGGWDVSSVLYMNGMFSYAQDFNVDIGSWDVKNVKSMYAMFFSGNYGSTSFNQDIGSWDVRNVENMSNMFYNAVFNQDISGWDVSKVGSFVGFLQGAEDFSTENYNKLLIEWSYLDLQTDVSFNANNAQFDLGLPQERRDFLIDSLTWNITDAGPTEEEFDLVHIKVVSNPKNAGRFLGTGSFPSGETITIEIQESPFFEIDNWSDPTGIIQSTTPSQITVLVPDNHVELKANFVLKDGVESFDFVVSTTAENTSYKFNVDKAFDFSVLWNDSSVNVYNGDQQPEFDFNGEGEWTIKVIGQAERIAFNSKGDMLSDILTPLSNGITGLTSAELMFAYTEIESFTCSEFFDDISGNITNTRFMFYRSDFNGDISSWDVSNVTSMSNMFSNSSFNGDISGWNVSNVESFYQFLNHSNFSKENYNALLVEWAKLDLVENVSFGAWSITYDKGEPEDAKNYIIDNFNWSFSDGGLHQYSVDLALSDDESGEFIGGGSYLEDALVDIEAIANTGRQFTHWSGDVEYLEDENSSTISFEMPQSDVDLTANFEKIDYNLTIAVDPEGTGDATGEGVYNYEDEVELSITVIDESKEFDGWYINEDLLSASLTTTISMPNSNTHITARLVTKTYTVTFIDWDDEVIETQTVEHGLSADTPSNPGRVGYTFTGWSESFDNITSSITVQAEYDINVYTVSFVDWDDSVIEEQQIEHASSATAPAEDPERDGHIFVGWSPDFDSVLTDLTVNAQYEIITYTVTFIDWDDEVIETQTVEHGSSADDPSDPERDGYTFTGWSESFDNIISDITVQAEYDINVYTVSFVDWDDSVIDEQQIEHANSATAPAEDPEREGYIFVGWSQDFDSVLSDLVIEAEYEIITYTVIFIDWDDDVIATYIVNHGSQSSSPSVPPRDSHSFVGWSDSSFMEVTQDLEITALYEINVYEVVFGDGFGNTILTQQVEHGQDAVEPDAPTREGYTFSGWFRSFENVTENLTVNAIFEMNSYEVIFLDWNSDTIDVRTVTHSDRIYQAPTPSREGYVFVGWSSDLSSITEDLSVVAVYEEDVSVLNLPTFSISLGPNPIKNELQITITETDEYVGKDVKLSVFDSRGRLFDTETININGSYNEVFIDVSSLPSGICFLVLEVDGFDEKREVFFKVEDM